MLINCLLFYEKENMSQENCLELPYILKIKQMRCLNNSVQATF